MKPMKRWNSSLVVLAVLCSSSLGFGSIGLGDDTSPRSASDQSEKSEKSEPEKTASTKIGGVFEAIQAIEITADTEHIDSLKIKRIASHGSTISEGKNVVLFETKDIDEQIKNSAIELRLSQLALGDAEFSYKQFQKTQALDRASADRSRQLAQQAFDNFVQVDRDRQILTAEYTVKSSKASLANATEELQQLEQMYKEDDLTEESEEIVLKRAKQAVESAQYRLAGTEISARRRVEQTIPQTQAQQEDSLSRAQLAHQKSVRDLESARQRRDIDIRRQRDKFKKQQRELTELKQERRQVALASPITGIVLLGKLNRGHLPAKPSTLEPGSKVTPKQVIATIVNPNKLRIRVALDEKNLSVVTVGSRCKVTSKAFPEFETVGTVKSVSPIAYAGTKHDCVITLRKTKTQPDILPTMSCDLEFVIETDSDNEDANVKDSGKKDSGKDE